MFIIPLSSVLPVMGQPVWYGQYLGLLFILFLGISLFLWDFNKYLSLFTIVLLYSTFFTTRLNPRAIILLFQFDMACLASYGLSRFNKQQRKYILWSVLGFFVLQIVLLGLQYINKDPIFKSLIRAGHSEMVGFSGSKDMLGSFFALTLPIVLYLNPLLSVFSIMGLFISKSSFALVSGCIAGLFYLKMRYKLLISTQFIFGVFLAILLSAIFFSKVDRLKPADLNTRLNVWRHTIKSTITGKIDIERNGEKYQGKINPVFGYGFGSYLLIFPSVPEQGFNYVDEKFTHAHNDYIEAFFELGYLGLISLILLVGNLIYSFIRTKKNPEMIMYFSCILAYLLNSIGNFLSQLAVSGMLLIIFYGFYEGTGRGIGKDTCIA